MMFPNASYTGRVSYTGGTQTWLTYTTGLGGGGGGGISNELAMPTVNPGQKLRPPLPHTL